MSSIFVLDNRKNKIEDLYKDFVPLRGPRSLLQRVIIEDGDMVFGG
jgi:hypothetical protein